MTARRFVVNASPLILLAKIDSLELVEELGQEVALPAAVRTEVSAGPGPRRCCGRTDLPRGPFYNRRLGRAGAVTLP